MTQADFDSFSVEYGRLSAALERYKQTPTERAVQADESDLSRVWVRRMTHKMSRSCRAGRSQDGHGAVEDGSGEARSARNLEPQV